MPEQNAPPSPAAPAPDAPTQSKPLTISDDTYKETGYGGKSSEAEAESNLRALDLEALHRDTRRELSTSNASDAIGMDSDSSSGYAAPTFFRRKLYTNLTESERWHFADECVEIMMRRVWENPHTQFDMMKKACDDFLIQQKLIITVSISIPVAPKYKGWNNLCRPIYFEPDH